MYRLVGRELSRGPFSGYQQGRDVRDVHPRGQSGVGLGRPDGQGVGPAQHAFTAGRHSLRESRQQAVRVGHQHHRCAARQPQRPPL